jgi:C1A family cysteine protease
MANCSASYLIQHSTGKRIKLGGAMPSQKAPPKSRKYGASGYQTSALPPRVDLRKYMTAVEDQSAVNSCTANAIAGAYEYLAKRSLGDAGDISRLFIYYNARQFDGIEGDAGSTITGSISVLQEMGACTEATWPYSPDLVDAEPDTNAYSEAEYYLLEDAQEIDVDLDAMKHCLAEGYPFAFGLRLFKSFDRAGMSGKVPMPNPDTEVGRESHGNHAMLCVGYSDAKQVFIVRNSWGEGWGNSGYCFIPYDYLANPDYCFDCWTIRSVSDLDFSTEIGSEEDEELAYDETDDSEQESDYEYAYDESEEVVEENPEETVDAESGEEYTDKETVDAEYEEEYTDEEEDVDAESGEEYTDEETVDAEYEEEYTEEEDVEASGEEEECDIYVVKSGDTLWSIAENYYGVGELWSLVYEANCDEIGDDPDALEIGLELVMPVQE